MRLVVIPSCIVKSSRSRIQVQCSNTRKSPDHLKRMDDAAKNLVKAAGVVAGKMGDRHNKHIDDLIGFASEEVNFMMALATEMKEENKNNKKHHEAQVVDVVSSTIEENDDYFEKKG